MTYNQHVFYKISWDTKPSREAAERTRLEQIKVMSLLNECISSVKFSNNKNKLLGNLMSTLQQLVKSSTSSKWENENIPMENLALSKAKQLLNDYYRVARNSRVVKVSGQKKRKLPGWEEKARASGIPVSSSRNKSKPATNKPRLQKLATMSQPKRGASVAPSYRKKPQSKSK